MKHSRLIVLIAVIISIYLIYSFNNNNNITYIALGDSLAAGEDSYGRINYGYGDYVRDYLKKQNKLKFYTKKYTSKEKTLTDIYEDIVLNKKINQDGKKVNIRYLLREASLLTITAGLNDLMDEAVHNQDKAISNVEVNLDKTIKEIKRYYKKDIYLIGYYLNNKISDELLIELNNMYKEYSKKNKIIYIEINNIFSNNNYFDNPNNIHPNYKGYEVISKKIIAEYNNK